MSATRLRWRPFHRRTKRWTMAGMRGAHRAVPLLAALLMAACDDDAMGPDRLQRADVEGSYEAETLLITRDGVPMNALALGAEVTVTLRADGTLTGRVLLPDEITNEGVGPADVMGSGTWTFDEDRQRVEIVLDDPPEEILEEFALVAREESGDVLLEGGFVDTDAGLRVDVVLRSP